ncbi:MAG: hypothetical protein J3R72DRAFT_520933 [Linnemannia gamsii]|nr:MAG: hypothetical protein J3R72DRAFT_520933 [Linnemannia gamsii]
MDKLPVEIIFAIGRFLRPPTLISSLQVCQRWHQILHPLIWKFIHERHWHHPYFPLREERLVTVSAALQAGEEKGAHIEKETTALDDPQLSGLLVNVYSLGWQDWRVIKGVPRREARGRSPLTLDTLERILLLAPNLVILNLSISVKFSISVVPLLATLHGLSRLKDLSLYIKDYEDTSPLAVEDLFPLFSRLNKLSFGGEWVASERQQQKRESAEIGAETGERGLQETLQSWKVKDLKSVSATGGFGSSVRSWCGGNLDTATYLPALGMLKTLLFPLTKLEDMEFLNTQTGFSEGGTLNSRLVLPLLETLFTGSSHIAREDYVRLQLAFRQFLMQRTRLKLLYLAPICIDPLYVFAQPGMELQHGWACSNLQSITLKLPSIFPWIRITSEEQRILMNSVYRQLGCLPRLRTLSIECDSSYEFHVPAILQLKGATSLWELTLTLVKGWTCEGIAMVVEGVPGLKALGLSLVAPNGQDIVIYSLLPDLQVMVADELGLESISFDHIFNILHMSQKSELAQYLGIQ